MLNGKKKIMKLNEPSNVYHAMKSTPFILLLLMLSTTTYAQTDSSNIAPTTFDCEIKTNGVYYANLDEDANIYIHFHQNDTVVTTSSIKDVDLASKFVNKKLGSGMLFGKYFTSDRTCSLRVKAENEYSKVKMDGIIRDDKLVLTVVNITENTARDFVFQFHELKK